MTDRSSPIATAERLPSAGRAHGKSTSAGGGQFDWNLIATWLVHPAKAAIIETLWRLGEAASPSDLARMVEEEHEHNAFGLSLIAYHAGKLAEMGILKVARTEEVGRNVETFYELVERW